MSVGAPDPWGILARLDELERKFDALLQRGGGAVAPALLSTKEAAKFVGLPTGAALRMAALRNELLKAARVDRRLWDRERLIAYVATKKSKRQPGGGR